MSAFKGVVAELSNRAAWSADDISERAVVFLEKRFGVKFATAEISRMKNDGENVGTDPPGFGQLKSRRQ